MYAVTYESYNARTRFGVCERLAIERNPIAAMDERYDVIIIGGGIQGAMLLLEATRRELKALVIERGDFGAETTYNNFRIVHGGLRSLQSLDIPRFRESVNERRWFQITFPDLVEPLSCLMPLYGGLRRPVLMRVAAWLNDMLAADRNRGVRRDRRLPRTRVLSRQETIDSAPQVGTKGLTGGLLWFDLRMPDSHRIVIEVFNWACSFGGRALNYVNAVETVRRGDHVQGLRALDVLSGDELIYRAPVVINAAGPWSAFWAADLDSSGELFVPSVAWNVRFDRAPLGKLALAVSTGRSDSQTYFIHERRGQLFAGTGYAGMDRAVAPDDRPSISDEAMARFVAELNECLPNLALRIGEIAEVMAGYVPVRRLGGIDLRTRALIRDHGVGDRSLGEYSVSGVKFTTARRAAVTAIRRICDKHFPKNLSARLFEDGERKAERHLVTNWDAGAIELARSLYREEAAQTMDDLMLRRLTLAGRALSQSPPAGINRLT